MILSSQKNSIQLISNIYYQIPLNCDTSSHYPLANKQISSKIIHW